MQSKVVKKSFATVVVCVILLVTLAISAAAGCGVLCNVCNKEANNLICTGVNTGGSKSHNYGFLWLFTCNYYAYTHQVATNCHRSDFGSHNYASFTHPDCGKYEAIFPCSDVPSWVVG